MLALRTHYAINLLTDRTTELVSIIIHPTRESAAASPTHWRTVARWLRIVGKLESVTGQLPITVRGKCEWKCDWQSRGSLSKLYLSWLCILVAAVSLCSVKIAHSIALQRPATEAEKLVWLSIPKEISDFQHCIIRWKSHPVILSVSVRFSRRGLARAENSLSVPRTAEEKGRKAQVVKPLPDKRSNRSPSATLC